MQQAILISCNFGCFLGKKLAYGIYPRNINILKMERRSNQYRNILMKRLKLQKYSPIIEYVIGKLLKNI